MPFLSRPDAELHYHVDDFTDPWLQSQSLLFHHGHARNLHFWRGWVPRLAGDYRLVRFDARGFGRSSVPESDFEWTPDVFIEDALALLDELEIERAVWVSELLGNIVGLSFALAHPERLRALVLCHPICSVSDVHDVPHATPVDIDALRQQIDSIGMREWAKTTLWQRLDAEAATDELGAWVVDQIAATSPTTVLSLRPQVAGWTQAVTDRLSEIEVPTLLLLADRSRASTSLQAEYMVSEMQNAQIETLPGAGDGIYLLHPDWCADQTGNFLKNLD